jgi:hypothetical protein
MNTMSSWLPTVEGNSGGTEVCTKYWCYVAGSFQESLLSVYNFSYLRSVRDNCILPTNCMDHKRPWEPKNSSVSWNPPDMEPDDVFKTNHHMSISLSQMKSISISNSSHACYMSHSAHPFLFDLPNHIWWRVQMTKTLMRILPDRK